MFALLICILSIQTIVAEENANNKELISNNNQDNMLKTNNQYNDVLKDYNYEEKKNPKQINPQ